MAGLKVGKNKVLERKFELMQDVIYRKPTKRIQNSRIIIPISKINEIFNQYHVEVSGGHFGADKTLSRINQYYWHPSLNRIIGEKIKECEICQKNKGPISREETAFIPEVGKFPMEILQMDVLGPLPETKRRVKFIITAIDTCTRYLFAEASKRVRAEETISFLKNIFNDKGIIKILQTDNGKNFVAEELADFLKQYDVLHKRSTTYHPQSQGMVERMNKTICERLRMYCQNNQDWDLILKEVVLSINSNINKITRKSAFFLMHGFEPRVRLMNSWNLETLYDPDELPLEREAASERTKQQQEKTLRRRDKPDRTNRLQVGDLVLKEIRAVHLDKGKHLTPRFKGPYLIIKILDKGCVLVYCFRSKKEIICNVYLLKKYFGKKPKGYLNVRSRYGMDSE